MLLNKTSCCTLVIYIPFPPSLSSFSMSTFQLFSRVKSLGIESEPNSAARSSTANRGSSCEQTSTLLYPITTRDQPRTAQTHCQKSISHRRSIEMASDQRSSRAPMVKNRVSPRTDSQKMRCQRADHSIAFPTHRLPPRFRSVRARLGVHYRVRSAYHSLLPAPLPDHGRATLARSSRTSGSPLPSSRTEHYRPRRTLRVPRSKTQRV